MITSGQSNLTKGRIITAHGRFTRIRQVAPMRTHLIHASLDPTRVQIPKDITIGSAVFAQLTTDGPYILYNGPLLYPSKLPLHTGDLKPN